MRPIINCINVNSTDVCTCGILLKDHYPLIRCENDGTFMVQVPGPVDGYTTVQMIDNRYNKDIDGLTTKFTNITFKDKKKVIKQSAICIEISISRFSDDWDDEYENDKIVSLFSELPFHKNTDNLDKKELFDVLSPYI